LHEPGAGAPRHPHFNVLGRTLLHGPRACWRCIETVRSRTRCKTGLTSRHHSVSATSGKHVGLITNHTGRFAGRSTVDILSHAPGVQLIALFIPEHGSLSATMKRSLLQGSRHWSPVHSLLLRRNASPTTENAQGQLTRWSSTFRTPGVRSTLYDRQAYCIEEAAKRNIAFFVLDRPQSARRLIVEGPMLEHLLHRFRRLFPHAPFVRLIPSANAPTSSTPKTTLAADLQSSPVCKQKRASQLFPLKAPATKLDSSPPNLRTTKGFRSLPGIEILQTWCLFCRPRQPKLRLEEFGAPWLNGD